MNWFYALNGQQAGPVADEELSRLVQSGTITPATLVWHSGMASWQPYSEIGAALGQPAGVGAVVGAGQAQCSQCGGVFPADEVVRVSNFDVCAGCKPLLLQKLQQGVSSAGVFGVRTMQYTGFWMRFAAAILDGLIVLPFGLLLNFIFRLLVPGINNGQIDPQDTGAAVNLVLASVGYYVFTTILTAVYNGICLSRFQGMPGMLICGLRVVRGDGQPISFARGTCRYLASILSFFASVIFLGAGYLCIVFNKQKRALHDFICDTRVIYK